MNLTILHVEDDPNDVMLIGRAFKKANVSGEMQVVNDGEQAVAYLSGNEGYSDREAHPMPTLVLLDLKLPRKAGLEVLTWIRGQEDLKRLPIVILTSSKQATDINRAYETGANCYLLKPVNFEEMLEMAKTIDQFWLKMNQNPYLLR